MKFCKVAIEQTAKHGGVLPRMADGLHSKMYREWQLSGDNNFFFPWKKIGPGKKSIVVCSAMVDGMETVMVLWKDRQHNTMDVNYFGPNPQMQFVSRCIKSSHMRWHYI